MITSSWYEMEKNEKSFDKSLKKVIAHPSFRLNHSNKDRNKKEKKKKNYL